MSDVDDSDLPNKKRRTETQPEVLPTAPHNAEPQPPAKPKRREFKCYCGPCYRQGGEAGFSLVSEKTLTAHRKKHKEELTEAYHLELAKRKAEGIGGGGAQHAQRVQGVHIDDGSGVDCGSMTLSNDRPPRRYGPALRRNLPEDVVEEQFQQEAAEEKERQRELRAERVAEEAAKEAERGTAVEEDEKQEESLRAAESQGLGRSKLEMIKLLNFKLKHNLTPECMEDLIALRPQVRGTEEEEDITQYELFKLLARLSHTSMKEYDCCRKSCMAFTGKHVQDDICAICGTSRWVEGSGNQKSATRFWYYSLSEQLKSRYRDPTYAEMARYRAKFCRSEEVLRDVFDGDLYQEQLNAKVRIDDEELECRFYENDVDACIGILLDGFRIFDRDEHNCWPVLAIDYNLPPAERYKTENVLIVALIPGPKSPKNLNSFLRPFVDDTKIWARHGSVIWDAVLQTTIKQKIFILLCSGDMPALALLMSMKGHKGKCPCRACSFVGAKLSTAPGNPGSVRYYYPLKPGPGMDREGKDCDPRNLPLRSHKAFMEQARYLEGMPTGARGYEVVSEFIGINGLPIISEVPGIDIPRSFSMELMHLLFENVMKDLRILWTGKLGTTTLTGDYPFVISQDDWDLVDVEVENASRDIPSEWGKKMPAPGRNQGWFTAEDYANFLNYVGPAVLHKRLQEPYYSHFLQFRSIALKLLHPNIPRRDINQGGLLSEAIVDWVTQYEELYFGGNAELLPVMTSAIHALLHVCEYTRWLGPLHLSWSFVVERYCQHAEKFVTSKFSPYASLALSVLRLEQMKSVKRRYPAVVETATEVAKRARPAEVHEDGFSFTGRRGFDRLSNHIFIRKAVETMFPALDRTASSEIEIARFWEFRKDGAEDVVEIQRPDALAQTRTTPIIRWTNETSKFGEVKELFTLVYEGKVSL